ncbi:putative major tailsheath [Pseudomonas phage OBP]|uniref:tail sheath n=1 Tax=Pseudomonas phage OBP TaxID=1124849 RepID=UPI000240D5E3|nr:tail sheath [Pseudomonas phage OBP]AEV89439.1 putative major tailsheath [Pseudomonas phage OBP]
METFNKVIPGKVVNEGIVSRETFPAAVPVISSPAHFPDFAAVTPRGSTKRATVSTGTFTSKFGDTTDPFGLYYNPVTYAIQKLGQAGQASFSFKRLTNNTAKSRTIIGLAIFSGDIPNYLRDGNGDYVLDAAGNPKVDETTATIAGKWVCTGVLKSEGEVGEAKAFEVTSTDETPGIPTGTNGKFYPLAEVIGGIGDTYNANWISIGHNFQTDWNEVARFVQTNGSYPFILNMGVLLDNGLRVPANTINGTPDTTFTMFDTVNEFNTRYGLKVAVDQYTGNNVNRPVEVQDAPFDDVFMYTQNLSDVAKELYAAEYGTDDPTNQPPNVLSKRLPKHAIMNMFDLVNHNGKPYKHIVFGGNFDQAGKVTGSRFSMNHYLQSNGGINPFADKDGKFPEAPTTWLPAIDGPWVADVSDPDLVISHKQAWEMNQMLIEAYLTTYITSLDVKDVIRNRSSFMWDVGYNQKIKDIMIQFLSKRKDIIVVPCATEYLRKKTQDELYSTATMLNTRIVMIPESEVYKSEACRASINLWDARYINEPTWGRFSLNIENMYAFAVAGGGADGRIYAADMPDHEGNRILRIAHDPFVEFEADDPAANNLIQGCITVTPITESQFCRPALPTVYGNINSVLKDLTNVWKCVVVEKILQDIWIQVSGDTQLGKEGYLSFVKDGAEKRIRDLFGSVISNWEVVPSFREDSPTSKSVMYSITRLWFGKGIYMLNSVLEAYNEDSLNAE